MSNAEQRLAPEAFVADKATIRTTFWNTWSHWRQNQKLVLDRLCVGFGAGRLDCILQRSNLPSCLSLQRLAISVQMIAVQTLERPMRAISSNTEPRLKVCSATAARRAERRSPKTPGRFSTGLHTGAEEIIETLALIAEGSRVASLSRVKGYKEETIRNWLQQAAEHATEIENVLMSEYEIERGQLDALWSYVGHKEQESGEGEKRSA